MAALSLQNQLFGFPSLGSGGTIAAGFSKTPPLSPMISSSPGCKSPSTISVLAPSFRPSWTVIAIGFAIAQDPELRRAIRWRPGTARAVRDGEIPRRIAQRLIGRADDIVAPVDYDTYRRHHAGFEQQIRIGRTDDDIIGRDVLDSLRRWTDLRYLSGEATVRISLDGERGLVRRV